MQKINYERAYISHYFFVEFSKTCDKFRNKKYSSSKEGLEFLNNLAFSQNFGGSSIQYKILTFMFIDRILNQKSYVKQQYKVYPPKHKFNHLFELNMMEFYYMVKHIKGFSAECKSYLENLPTILQYILVSYLNNYNIFGIGKEVLQEFYDKNNLSEFFENEFDIVKYYDFLPSDFDEENKENRIKETKWLSNLQDFYILNFDKSGLDSELGDNKFFYYNRLYEKVDTNIDSIKNVESVEILGLIENIANNPKTNSFLIIGFYKDRIVTPITITYNTTVCKHFSFSGYSVREIDIKKLKEYSDKYIEAFELSHKNVLDICGIKVGKINFDFIKRVEGLFHYLVTKCGSGSKCNNVVLSDTFISILENIKVQEGIIADIVKGIDYIVYNVEDFYEMESKEDLTRYSFKECELIGKVRDFKVGDRVNILEFKTNKGLKFKFLGKIKEERE